MTQLRLELDKKHKCLLLKDSKIGDKECQDKNNTAVIKKVLKRELVSNRKYKTTYKDIKKYFKIINKAVFHNVLSPLMIC